MIPFINQPSMLVDDFELVLEAAAYAAYKHCGQHRKDVARTPYVNHPIALAETLCHEGGVQDPVVLAAALLHDTIEDTRTTRTELEVAFGTAIAAVVVEVTDDKMLAKAERKRLQIEHAAALSHNARLVKLADKICNVRDVAQNPPVDWSPKRRCEYFEWAKAVVDRLRGTHGELERRFDAAYVQWAEVGDACEPV